MQSKVFAYLQQRHRVEPRQRVLLIHRAAAAAAAAAGCCAAWLSTAGEVHTVTGVACVRSGSSR
jgi:hypothetical protein